MEYFCLNATQLCIQNVHCYAWKDTGINVRVIGEVVLDIIVTMSL